MGIVGFSGQMRAGKDESADYLATKFPNWKRIAFATQVKKLFCDAFDVDLDFVEQWKVSAEPPPGFKKNVRQALQFIGDGFREIQDDIWIEYCFKNNPDSSIISDVRYVNELKKIRSLGGFNVLIYRPGFLNDDPNGSEAQIRPALDFFCNMKVLNETIGNIAHPFEGPTDVLLSNLTPSDEAAIPEAARKINYFIRNEGTKEELYEKIDSKLVPYLKQYFGE